jgi:hypothetical protein
MGYLVRLFTVGEGLGGGSSFPIIICPCRMNNKAKDMGLLNLPIPINSTQDFPIIQYVDDTLIIDEGDARQLLLVN